MDIKSITKGITAGAAVGLACYAFSTAGGFKKRSMKRNAGKTLKAAGDLIEDITSVLR